MTRCELVEVEPQVAAVWRGAGTVADLPHLFGRAFTQVLGALAAQGVEPVGPPVGYYPAPPGDLIVVEAGFPTAEPIEPDGDVVPRVLPHGPAVTLSHRGPYDGLGRAYVELQEWARDRGLALGEAMWESYESGPGSQPDPAEWRTRIVWPLVVVEPDRPQ